MIAYGKLGGKELGYASDLDVIFLYDDPDDAAADVYSTYTRRLITWLGPAGLTACAAAASILRWTVTALGPPLPREDCFAPRSGARAIFHPSSLKRHLPPDNPRAA